MKGQERNLMKNSMAFSIPDEGVQMQRLPKDVKLPFYKNALLLFANPFSEVEKVMQTYTSHYENESALDENEPANFSVFGKGKNGSPQLFTKIPSMIKNSISLTPEIQSKHKEDQ